MPAGLVLVFLFIYFDSSGYSVPVQANSTIIQSTEPDVLEIDLQCNKYF